MIIGWFYLHREFPGRMFFKMVTLFISGSIKFGVVLFLNISQFIIICIAQIFNSENILLIDKNYVAFEEKIYSTDMERNMLQNTMYVWHICII